jgi:hypothetical protein
MFTKARWDKSFIFNSIRLRREWLTKREFAKAVRVCLEFLPYRLLNRLPDHHEKLLTKLIRVVPQ